MTEGNSGLVLETWSKVQGSGGYRARGSLQLLLNEQISHCLLDTCVHSHSAVCSQPQTDNPPSAVGGDAGVHNWEGTKNR